MALVLVRVEKAVQVVPVLVELEWAVLAELVWVVMAV